MALRECVMIVCVCNAIREEDLRGVARKGQACPRRAYAELGRRPKCGMCLDFARTVMTEAQQSA